MTGTGGQEHVTEINRGQGQELGLEEGDEKKDVRILFSMSAHIFYTISTIISYPIFTHPS